MNDQRKVTFAINMTLDGYTDHTVMTADNEAHEFFAGLMDDVGILLFGRIMYEMMAGYWPAVPNDPNATQGEIDFARKYNALPKLVLSKTIQTAEWGDTRIVRGNIVEEVIALKKLPGKNISVDSIMMFQELLQHDLIDEFWLVVHPLICPEGKRLFVDQEKRLDFTLAGTRTFSSGVVALHYIRKR